MCWIDEETRFIVHPNFVLNAEYNFITDILENPTNKFADIYKKVKAEIVCVCQEKSEPLAKKKMSHPVTEKI